MKITKKEIEKYAEYIVLETIDYKEINKKAWSFAELFKKNDPNFHKPSFVLLVNEKLAQRPY